MALTRANAEFLMEARLAPLLTAAGMDGTTVDGTNVDLSDPIARAVRDLGYEVASAVLVADADVAQITAAQTSEFLDACELHTMNAILGNLDDVDITVGPRSEKLSQLAMQIERKIKRLLAAMGTAYGYGMATPDAGYITLDFAEHE